MWTPYVMLICLAGLRSIPDYIYEAAEVDRASVPAVSAAVEALHRFREVGDRLRFVGQVAAGAEPDGGGEADDDGHDDEDAHPELARLSRHGNPSCVAPARSAGG